MVSGWGFNIKEKGQSDEFFGQVGGIVGYVPGHLCFYWETARYAFRTYAMKGELLGSAAEWMGDISFYRYCFSLLPLSSPLLSWKLRNSSLRAKVFSLPLFAIPFFLLGFQIRVLHLALLRQSFVFNRMFFFSFSFLIPRWQAFVSIYHTPHISLETAALPDPSPKKPPLFPFSFSVLFD